MKVYLVGGAVRDQLLNLPIKERDWVVVGATPELLLAQHYLQVGRDFPVFLHPKTKEEYALARKERKSAPGYYGFHCDFSDQVTLEEDLARRDLTINAMAMDENHRLIDPYHGQRDLQNRILRHVSPAFIEDPVRVLRVARFAARFAHLGFRLADETRSLMYTMLCHGELNHLVPERVWQEWECSLFEKNPEIFIETLRSCGALAVILPELNDLFGVPNPVRYHKEIDSGVHSLLVLQQACQLSDDPILRFAALVHDLGKAKSPIANWPSHHGHEDNGVPIIESLCMRLRIPNEYRKLATKVSRFHLTIHRLGELKASTVVKVFEQMDAFRTPQLFQSLLLACEADARGCGRSIGSYTPSERWLNLLSVCRLIKAQTFIEKGYAGEAIKKALHQERVMVVDKTLKFWKTNEE